MNQGKRMTWMDMKTAGKKNRKHIREDDEFKVHVSRRHLKPVLIKDVG